MQKFKHEARMSSENECVFEFNNVVMWILIIQQNSLKNLNLNFGLPIKFRMILDYLECNLFFLFVIKRLENLPKWTRAQRTHNFIPICDRVSDWYLDVTLVVSKVFNWWNSSQAWTVNFVFLYFFLLKFCHVWKFTLFICWWFVLMNVDLTVSDLGFDASELIFL